MTTSDKEPDEIAENALEEPDERNAGIEPDNIELPDIPETVGVDAQPPAPVKDAPAVPEKSVPPAGKSKFLFYLIGSVVGLIAAVLVLFFLFRGEGREGRWRYHAIGPIVTNLGNSRQINVALSYRYDPVKNDRPETMEPVIIDGVLVLLSSPETQQISREADVRKREERIREALQINLRKKYRDTVLIKSLTVSE